MKKYPDFQEINLDDRVYFNNYFSCFKNEISEYTFASLFCWRKYYSIRTCCYKGIPLILSDFSGETVFFYTCPDDSLKTEILELQLNYLRSLMTQDKTPEPAAAPGTEAKHKSLKIFLFSETDIRALSPYVFTEDRNNFDYLYKSYDLAFLPGKIYDGKRNRVKLCEKQNPETVFINKTNIKDCLELQREWLKDKTCSPSLRGENEAVMEALKHFDSFGMQGIAIRINGKIAAFSVGEKLNSSAFLVLFEKADISYPGIYQYINNAFSKIIHQNYEFINREQDMGLSGIRKAKTSYHPYKFVKKYSLIL